MNDAYKLIIRVGIVLGLFSVIATSLVAFTEQKTHKQIAENDKQAVLHGINEIVSTSEYDNAILKDTVTLPPTKLLGTSQPTKAFIARKAGKPVAAIFTAIAPNGYSGKISLLVGIYHNGDLAGVRVIKQNETPGLGDKIDEKKTNWIFQFKGLSLNNPTLANWKVSKDGGHFDQFTGATITPRAVVGAIKNALIYFKTNRDALFADKKDSQ